MRRTANRKLNQGIAIKNQSRDSKVINSLKKVEKSQKLLEAKSQNNSESLITPASSKDFPREDVFDKELNEDKELINYERPVSVSSDEDLSEDIELISAVDCQSEDVLKTLSTPKKRKFSTDTTILKKTNSAEKQNLEFSNTPLTSFLESKLVESFDKFCPKQPIKNISNNIKFVEPVATAVVENKYFTDPGPEINYLLNKSPSSKPVSAENSNGKRENSPTLIDEKIKCPMRNTAMQTDEITIGAENSNSERENSSTLVAEKIKFSMQNTAMQTDEVIKQVSNKETQTVDQELQCTYISVNKSKGKFIF